MNRIDNILEDVHTVKADTKHVVSSTNGIMDPNELETIKDKVLKFATMHLRKDIFKVKQHYPGPTKSEVDVSLDVVVMSGKQFNELKRLVDEQFSK